MSCNREIDAFANRKTLNPVYEVESVSDPFAISGEDDVAPIKPEAAIYGLE